MKQIYDIDIKRALSGEAIPTSTRWTQKEPKTRQDFFWGAGLSQSKPLPLRYISRKSGVHDQV